MVVYVGFSEAALLFSGNAQYALSWLGIEEHYRSIRRGVVDTRDVLYFFSVVCLFLYFSVHTLKMRRR